MCRELTGTRTSFSSPTTPRFYLHLKYSNQLPHPSFSLSLSLCGRSFDIKDWTRWSFNRHAKRLNPGRAAPYRRLLSCLLYCWCQTLYNSNSTDILYIHLQVRSYNSKTMNTLSRTGPYIWTDSSLITKEERRNDKLHNHFLISWQMFTKPKEETQTEKHFYTWILVLNYISEVIQVPIYLYLYILIWSVSAKFPFFLYQGLGFRE